MLSESWWIRLPGTCFLQLPPYSCSLVLSWPGWFPRKAHQVTVGPFRIPHKQVVQLRELHWLQVRWLGGLWESVLVPEIACRFPRESFADCHWLPWYALNVLMMFGEVQTSTCSKKRLRQICLDVTVPSSLAYSLHKRYKSVEIWDALSAS